jgi:membrane-associated phospholipid phosphatase
MGLFVALASGSPREEPSSWDARLTYYIQGLHEGGSLANELLGVALHPVVQLLGVLAVLAAAVSFWPSRRVAVFVVLTLAGALVFEPVLKEVLQRPPVEGPATEYSFPSGHALRSMAGALALILLLWQTRLRWTAVLGGALAVGVIGIAVVHQDWHWVSDVLGAWCLGGAWVALLYLIIRPVPRAIAKNPAPTAS